MYSGGECSFLSTKILHTHTRAHTHTHTHTRARARPARSLVGRVGKEKEGKNTLGVGVGAGGSERTGRNPEERNAEIAGRQVPPPAKPVISPVLSPAGQSLLRLLGAARAPAGAHTGPLLPVLAFDISLHTVPHPVELFPPSSLRDRKSTRLNSSH